MFYKVKVNANKYFEYFSWISVLDPKKDWFVSIPKTYLSARRRKHSALIKIFSAPNNKNAGKNSKHLINYSYWPKKKKKVQCIPMLMFNNILLLNVTSSLLQIKTTSFVMLP